MFRRWATEEGRIEVRGYHPGHVSLLRLDTGRPLVLHTHLARGTFPFTRYVICLEWLIEMDSRCEYSSPRP